MNSESRRSMSEALQTINLPVEAIALIKEGAPKPQTARSALSGTPPNGRLSHGETTAPADRLIVRNEAAGAVTKEAGPADTAEVAPVIPVSRAKAQRKTEFQPVVAVGSLAVTVRLPAELPGKLLRVATDRKLNRQPPWTQQEIVTEALAEWLERNGY